MRRRPRACLNTCLQGPAAALEQDLRRALERAQQLSSGEGVVLVRWRCWVLLGPAPLGFLPCAPACKPLLVGSSQAAVHVRLSNSVPFREANASEGKVDLARVPLLMRHACLQVDSIGGAADALIEEHVPQVSGQSRRRL